MVSECAYYMYICVCITACVFMFTCVCVCVCMCVSVCVCVHVRACMHEQRKVTVFCSCWMNVYQGVCCGSSNGWSFSSVSLTWHCNDYSILFVYFDHCEFCKGSIYNSSNQCGTLSVSSIVCLCLCAYYCMCLFAACLCVCVWVCMHVCVHACTSLLEKERSVFICVLWMFARRCCGSSNDKFFLSVLATT